MRALDMNFDTSNLNAIDARAPRLRIDLRPRSTLADASVDRARGGEQGASDQAPACWGPDR